MQTEPWEIWNLYAANELYVIMFLILTICVSGETAQLFGCTRIHWTCFALEEQEETLNKKGQESLERS